MPNVNFLILNLNNPLAWILPHVPQHPLVQFSKHLLPLSVFSGQFLGLPCIQVSALPGGLNALSMFVDLILFFLSGFLRSQLVLFLFPDLSTHFEFLFAVPLPPDQVVELVHGQTGQLIDIQHDVIFPGPPLVQLSNRRYVGVS